MSAPHDGTAGAADAAEAAEAAALRLRRLELDNDDLRAENARLKASMLQKQEEIVMQGERLLQLKARLDTVHRVAAWGRLRRLNPLRSILRRMG